MEKSQKVSILSSIILVGFVFGVIYHYILSAYLGWGDTYNSFVYPPSFAFCDFCAAFPFIKDFNLYQDKVLWVTYFPFAYFFIIPFAFIKNLVLSYLIYISGFVSYLIYMNIKNFSCTNLTKLENIQNIFIITALSYPFLYNIDKGNLDMFLFVLFGFFVYTFRSEKYMPSAILLAMQNAMKPFTFLFLFLFLFKKKYKEFFISILLTTLFTIGAFLFFKGGFFNQIVDFLKTLTFFKYRYAYYNDDSGMGFASSLFMLLKLIFCKSTVVPLIPTDIFTKIYDYLSYVVMIVTLFFVWREKVFWKQLTLLICNFILLPYITYDYKLIFLFVPIWLFVNAKEKTKFDLAYIIMFALLFIPKNIVIANHALMGDTIAKWFSLSIIINPILLILLSVLIIYEQFSSKKELIEKDES